MEFEYCGAVTSFYVRYFLCVLRVCVVGGFVSADVEYFVYVRFSCISLHVYFLFVGGFVSAEELEYYGVTSLYIRVFLYYRLLHVYLCVNACVRC